MLANKGLSAIKDPEQKSSGCLYLYSSSYAKKSSGESFSSQRVTFSADDVFLIGLTNRIYSSALMLYASTSDAETRTDS